MLQGFKQPYRRSGFGHFRLRASVLLRISGFGFRTWCPRPGGTVQVRRTPSNTASAPDSAIRTPERTPQCRDRRREGWWPRPFCSGSVGEGCRSGTVALSSTASRCGEGSRRASAPASTRHRDPRVASRRLNPGTALVRSRIRRRSATLSAGFDFFRGLKPHGYLQSIAPR